MRHAFAFCLAVFACAAAGVCHAADPVAVGRAVFSDADRVDLARVNTYLNSIHTMKGGFSQIDPNGDVDKGSFVISKPGRMRFEYKPPAPTLIVSDGTTVAITNTKLKTVDRYPLSQTPLDLIVGDRIDLLHNHSIVGVFHEQDALVVKARSMGGTAQGNISLVFALPNLELRQWTVTDNQGLQTTVALRDVQIGADVSGVRFNLPDKNPYAHKQGD